MPGTRLAIKRNLQRESSRETAGTPTGSSIGLGALDSTSSLHGSAFHPLFNEQLSYSAKVVGDRPDDQVSATIKLMRQYVCEDAQSPEIRAEAANLHMLNGDDPYVLTRAVWQTVKSKIQFLRDEVTGLPLESFMSRIYSDGSPQTPVIEVLIRPRDMLALQSARFGDCDDFSMYAACLLVALGIPCNFVTLAGDPKYPQIFSHVYVAAYPDSSMRVVVDASHGACCGWEALRPGARKQEWAITKDSPHTGSLGPILVLAASFLLGACF